MPPPGHFEARTDSPPADDAADRRAKREQRFSAEELARFETSLIYLDDLTGLYNRRFLSHLSHDRWQDLTAGGAGLALVIIDLDLFKDVNDNYGHLVGDGVLREIAELLRKHFRKHDFVIRYGGDEFVVILPGADEAEARKLARRAREAIANHRFVARETEEPIEVPVSFSLGAASFPRDGGRAEEVLAAADRRLYADKKRRQVTGSRTDVVRPVPASAAPASAVPASIAVARTAGTAAAAAFLGALLIALYLGFGRPADPVPGEGGAEDRLPSGTTETGAVETELREQILELQARLESLPVELPPTRDVYAEYEARIRELEATIVDLQTELDETQAAPADPLLEEASPATEGGDASPVENEGTASSPEPETSPPEARPPDETTTALSSGVDATGAPAAASVPAAGVPAAGVPASSVPGDDRGAFAPVIERPSPIASVNAQYPAAARRMNKEATVLVRVLVGAAGNAVRAEVVGKRAGLGFDEAASTAALRATYRPGLRNGTAVEMETLIKVEFRLESPLAD